MRPDDFDDFDDEPVTVALHGSTGKMTPELKHTIRKMIRDAIRWQNQQVLFTCRQCCFYQCSEHEVQSCTLNAENKLVLGRRMPTQMPECFTFDPLASSFADLLLTMACLGIETFKAERGWASIVGRIAQRADRFGYITGVTQKNLDKYGTG